MSTSAWKLCLFGKMNLTTPEGDTLSVQSRKCSELLAYLALTRNGLADRDAVVDAIWPDVDPFSGRARLKQVLARLRREVPGLPIFTSGKNEIGLSLDLIDVDYHAIDRRLKWLSALTLRRRMEATDQNLEIIRHGLLPELSGTWVQGERLRFQNIVRDLQIESVAGNKSTGAVFRIGDELGSSSGSLIGRERELSDVFSWLGDDDPRLAHLIGAPGVGKTRILVEALANCNDYCDAVLSLSTVQDSEAPWQERLCQATGILDKDKLTAGLVRLFKDFSRPLLAIDDVDQADDAMADWIEQLLRGVPRLRMIGTTRQQPTNRVGRLFEINPLFSSSDSDSAAARLLKHFASQAGLSEESIQASGSIIWELSDHLEGLPLALEIAAGWLPFMSPDRLLDKIRTGSNLLTQKAAAGRRSLLECMAPICEQLPSNVREALVCLSVCKGGCGEALVEAMLGAEWPWLIRSLCDRSLAQRIAGLSGARFMVLQALRDSVISLSTASETKRAVDVHTEACFNLGETATWEINEGDRSKWLTWLRYEGDNLLVACDRSLAEPGGAKRALILLSCLRAAFWLIGRPAEHSRLSRRACADWDAFFTPLTAEAPWLIVENRLNLLCEQEEYAEAVELAIQYRHLTEACGDLNGASAALDYEGETRSRNADYEGAFKAIEGSAKLKVAMGLPRQALWLEAKLARIETALGRFGDSRRRKERAFSLAREIGDANSEGMYAKEFAKIAMSEGKWAEARSLAGRSVAAFGLAGESSTRVDALLVLAATMIGMEDSTLALEIIEEAERENPFADDDRLGHLSFLRNAVRLEHSSSLEQELIARTAANT